MSNLNISKKDLQKIIEASVRNALIEQARAVKTPDVKTRTDKAKDFAKETATDHFKEGLFELYKENVVGKVKDILFMVVGYVVNYFLANVIKAIILCLFLLLVALIVTLVKRIKK